MYSWLLVTFSIVALIMSSSSSSSSSQLNCKITFYGARDNCPPSGEIAYPIIHKEAGGLGTYDNPITFASAKRLFSPGTRIYYPTLEKYFVMEDSCEECTDEYALTGACHVDLWMVYLAQFKFCSFLYIYFLGSR